MEFWEENLLLFPPTDVAATSLPSKPLNWFEIPRPAGLKGEYIYNHFVHDEDTNESGQTTVSYYLSDGDSPAYFDASMVDPGSGELVIDYQNFMGDVPRFVNLIFTPVELSLPNELMLSDNLNSEAAINASENNETLIRNNLDSLMQETRFTAAGAQAVPFARFFAQDNNILTESKKLIELSAEIMKLQNPGLEESSIISAIKAIMAPDTPNIDEWDGVQRFFDLATHSEQHGVATFDTEIGDYVGMGSIGFDRVLFNGLLNMRNVADIVTKMAATPIDPFAEDMGSNIKLSVLWQQSLTVLDATQDENIGPWYIDEDEYEIMLDNSDTFPQQEFGPAQGDDPNLLALIAAASIWGKGQKLAIKPLGYIMEKFELVPSPQGGTVWVAKDPVVFGSPYLGQGIDTKIKANTTYLYRPRTVVNMQIAYFDEGPGDWKFKNFMLASTPGAATVVTTTQDAAHHGGVPPDVPRDLKFVWDYSSNTMTMHWSFPVEKELDVKYFKIYRRSSFFEPFQLLSLYDFNEKPKESAKNVVEMIRPSLVKKFITLFQDKQFGAPERFGTMGQTTLYVDDEFNKESVFIYTLVAVDVAGQSSNYSQQFAVSFNVHLNRLEVELVSPSGAPEPYPNWFLREDIKDRMGQASLTTDLIKCSDYNTMYIGLDPDVWKITEQNVVPPGNPHAGTTTTTDVGHLKLVDDVTGEFKKGKYYLVINNLDRHKNQIIEISLRNTNVPLQKGFI